MRTRPLTVKVLLVCILALFLLVGCAGFYEKLGFDKQEAAEQSLQDKIALAQAIQEGRVLFWQVVSVCIGGAGSILTVLLGKLLNTERKISGTLIRGVESANKTTVKASIKAEALAAGIEPKLHSRVVKLT